MLKILGDVCKLKGNELEPVDCITGGSPCQDLSIAGKQRGLSGERSCLFFEQMRIVEEMRKATQGKSPRYMIWENVANSLSCNKGKDFLSVLMECVNVSVRTSFFQGTEKENRSIQAPPAVPMPKNGKWPKSGILYDDLGRWSIVWRLHDAQYWGVAQRRRRIALVCDFGGLTAPEVLFEQQSMSGNFNPSNAQREGRPEASNGSFAESDQFNATVGRSERGLAEHYDTFSINGDAHESGMSCIKEVAHTLKVTTKESVIVPDSQIVIDRAAFHQGKNAMFAPHIKEEETIPTLVSSGPHAVCQKFDKQKHLPCICIGNGQAHVTSHYTEEVSQTLNCMHDPMTILEHGDQATYRVRRLTPLECTRLQGFPDHWVDIGDWVDTKRKKHKDADAPKYKALGNSIALPFWKWLCRNIINKIKENDKSYKPKIGGLFSGIGGFELCWKENGGKCSFASEIDEFCIAVLKKHF